MSDRRILVVGAGYVGLITAVGLVRLGHRVEVVETRRDRRESLVAGDAPVFERGVDEILRPAVASGQLVATELPSDATYDIVEVCVGTPIGDDGSNDLSQLRGALHAVRPLADEAAIVVRSTTPVGSFRRLIEEIGIPSAAAFLNPEFLRQGTALADFLAPTRIVVGAAADADPERLGRVQAVVAQIEGPRLHVTYEEAEIIKNAANAFLALKLSFTNEMAALSEAYGADIDRVLEGIAHDPRIGGAYLRPSFGFGGSCLPKELKTITLAGRERGLPMYVTAAASAANAGTQRRFADRILDELDGSAGRRVAMLGLAFKAWTDDIRESPAIAVATLLRDAGVEVVGYDPEASDNARSAAPWLQIAHSAEAALDGAHAAVISTEWPAFRDIDWAAASQRMAGQIVVDGRRLLDPVGMRALGYRYIAVGSAIQPAGLSGAGRTRGTANVGEPRAASS
jgi:UDPglucose 6-dehydrogenase